MKKFPYIDALRGIAILGVILWHTTSFGSNRYPLLFNHLITEGARGVQLFYILSAVTLCLSLRHRLQHEKQAIRNFYIRRFFRIAPLFYLSIVYYLWQFGYWSHNLAGFSLANIFSTFTFFNGFHPYWINNIVPGGWSIPVEVGFYLLLPWLFHSIKKIEWAAGIALVGIVVMQLLRLFLLQHSPIPEENTWKEFTFLFFPSQLPVFLIGILTYFVVFIKVPSERVKKVMLYFGGTCLIFVVLQLLTHLKIIAGHYLYAMFFGASVWYLSGHQLSIVVNPVTRFLGKVSFSLYLCHFAVLYWMAQMHLVDLLPRQPLLNYGARFGLLVLLSSLVATVLYYGIEIPGQELGKKVISRLEGKLSYE